MIMSKQPKNHEKYFKMFEKIQKIIESSEDEVPKLEYKDKVPELEYVPRGNFIICTGSIVPEDNPTTIIKYSD